jgi:hypothetical protein
MGHASSASRDTMTTMRLASLLASLIVLCSAVPAGAASVVVATGGTRDELQAAVDALGGPGVVLVPPGEWELIGTVTVTADDVTILGAGADHTRLFRASDNPDANLAAAPFIMGSGARLRVASLRIDGVATASSTAADKGVRIDDVADFRVDHCVLTHLGLSGVITYGTSRGVVDHNRILDGFKPAINNLGYGVTTMGDGSYSGLAFGTPEATFIEDNFVSGARHAAAANNGARYVFRYNHVTANENSHGVDAHGDEYNGSSNTGTEWIEVYHNLIDHPVATSAAVRIRGGKGIVWANEVDGYARGVSLWENTPEPTGPVYIWGNTWGSGVTPVGDIQGSPSYATHAPASYTPYTYPHPLVTDLDVVAGPDMVLMADGAAPALAYIDGSATSASSGQVSAYRWIEHGTDVVSTCARDILALDQGDHLLLLEAERDDGLVEHDTVLVRVVPQGPLTSAPSWSSLWFVPLVSTGSVSFTLTPSAAPEDAYVALSGRHPVGAHPDQAMLVRTSASGVFEAYDGTQYHADSSLPYQAGVAYQVVVTFDLAAQTYDVAIDGTPLAQGYAFRRQESSIGQLTAWHASGGLSVQDVVIDGERAQPDPACRAEPPDGGAGGQAGAGAGSPAGGMGAAPPSGVAADGRGSDAGCGCRLATGSPGAPLLAVGLGVLGCWRRRRRAR